MITLRSGVLAVAMMLVAAGAGATSDDALDLGGDFLRVRTPSVRLYVLDGAIAPPAKLHRMEEAIQQIADRLELAPSVLASLRANPIEYVLLAEPSLLVRLGAVDVDGLAQPARRRVISTRLPHTHEIAHVLAHLHQPDAPESNAPLLQEGLATFLGGMVDLSPLASLAEGEQVLQSQSVDLRSLWSRAGWDSSRLSGRQRYGVAARFVQFLVEARGGMPRLLRLQRLLAGSGEEVAQRPVAAVIAQVEGIYDTEWTVLLEDFRTWRSGAPVGVVRESSLPRSTPDIVEADVDQRIRFWRREGGWVIAAETTRRTPEFELRWGRMPPREDGTFHRFALSFEDRRVRLVDRSTGLVLAQWYGAWNGEGTHTSSSVWRAGDEVFAGAQPILDPVLWAPPRFEVE